MILSFWSVTRLGLVAAIWIAPVSLVGPRLGRRPSSWRMTAPDGTVQLEGTSVPARRDLIIALVAFGPPLVLLVAWWVQRR